MNTLSRIQSLPNADSLHEGNWELYLEMFEALPTLINQDLMDRTWIMDVPDDILIGNKEPLCFSITSQRREVIQKMYQSHSFNNQQVLKWLRDYLNDDVKRLPPKETPDYVFAKLALCSKAEIAMFKGLYQHVDFFRTIFKDSRTMWLTWEYLTAFIVYEGFFSNRWFSSSFNEPFFIGKEKRIKLFRQDTKQEDLSKDDCEEIDYSHFTAFLQSDPVLYFSEIKDQTQLEAILVLRAACMRTAQSNLSFEEKYWIPFRKAEKRFMNAMRGSEFIRMPHYHDDMM